MASPVVVDGRLDREKLLELLAIGAEHDELDFKATLDLLDAKRKLGFVLDIIAMMNAAGGFIVLGAHDNGKPAHDRAPLDAGRFDSANLGALVARHIVAQPRVTSQVHEVEERVMVLVHVAPSLSGLPVIVSKVGEYDAGDGKTKKTVFQQGVVYTREGTRNVAASDAHWDALLSRYRSRLLAEAREGADMLIRRFVESLGPSSPGAPSLPPLLLEMDPESFVEALRQHIDAGSNATITRFLREARRAASYNQTADPDEGGAILDKLALAGIETMRSRRPELFEAVIAALHRVYESGGPVNEYSTTSLNIFEVPIAAHWREVLVRVWLIGAAAERERDWASIRLLALRPVDLGGGEKYPSWLRHGIVYASRARLFAEENHGDALVLSMAREHATEVEILADDILLRDAADPVDELLDSLARFDILWCLVMAIGADDLSYRLYPSAAALNQERANPALRMVATSPEVREQLAPGVTDREWAVALRDVLDLAVTQSRNHGTSWRGSNGDGAVFSFIRAHLGDA
ncbi:helix-turn-helix domain-containing protein [Microbacterium sp. VKM Ac-2923]|uniref:AlbA family DNA-binding domain-containing protein n=1 Tax=Microbacterium sp. VKM Ac-2923 TaxID=2929476 RepID=UPI001FB51388|nr:ATP-binding protein [Microbacterium sp. VKM Ac-2923]MCJ1706901.1 ATP-binding protein [Microbacterium sp. VKM Ac-2923]